VKSDALRVHAPCASWRSVRPILMLAVLVLAPGLASDARAQGAQELLIRWDQRALAAGERAFVVNQRRTLPDRPARQRNPELSPNHLVVEAVTAAGVVVDRQYILDPRVVRSESGDDLGELSGQVLRRATADLLLVIPDDPSITTLRLLTPRWTGQQFALDLAGTIPLSVR